MDYLPKDAPDFLDLVSKSELALLDAVIFDSYHVLLLLLSSISSAVPMMRLSQDSSSLPFCLLFGRFTSPGSFGYFSPSGPP